MISFQVLISLTIIVLVLRHSDAEFSKEECVEQLQAIGFVDDNGFVNFCHTMRAKTFKEFREYLNETYPGKIVNENIVQQFFKKIKSANSKELYATKLLQIEDLCIEHKSTFNSKMDAYLFHEHLYHCKVAVTGTFFGDNPFINFYKAYFIITNKSPTVLSESDINTCEVYKKMYLVKEENDSLFSVNTWCSNASHPPADPK